MEIKISKTLWLSALALAINSAPGFAADSCAPVDLRADLGAPRDQGNTGWCFSHTTADLISHKTRVRVSAFDLGIQFAATEIADLENSPSRAVQDYLREVPALLQVIKEAREDDRGTLAPETILTDDGIFSHGGVEDAALLMANHRGLCEDRFFKGGEDGFNQHLKEMRRWVKYNREDPAGISSPHDIPEASKPIFRKILGWLEHQCGSRVPLRDALVPRALYAANSLKDFLNRSPTPDFPLKELQKALWTEVDRALNEKKVAAVGYSAFDITEQAPEETTLDGDHSSIIAARRPVNGECQYFVRNSWGASCELYLPAWLKSCEEKDGGVWVRQADLKTIYSVVTYR